MARNAIIALVAVLSVGIAACSSPAAPLAPGPGATLAPVPAATLRPANAPTPPVVTPKPVKQLTRAQENAIEAAEDYLDYSAFSRSGLIDQLVYEDYSKAVATFAVDSLDVNWKEQAFLSAQAYLDYSSFSLKGLIDQLRYEGFTKAQAEYGAEKAYN